MTPALIHDDTVPAPGRPVELVPAPRGLWLVLLGAGVALLAPMAGFLVGVLVGPDYQAPLPPMFGGLLFGFIVGGLGVIAAAIGGRRLYLDAKARREG